MAICSEHGFQHISCDESEPHTPSLFKGSWPGALEAAERGLFGKFDSKKGWISCGVEEVGAQPDLNRVVLELTWNPSTELFE